MSILLLKAAEPSAHHSFTDWDLTAYCTIHTGYYVSAPSSLRIGGSSGAYYGILGKSDLIKCISEGTAIFWFRAYGSTNRICFVFRNTRALGGVDLNNCYLLRGNLQGNTWLLQEFSGGVNTRSWTETKNVWALSTWYKLRVMWWLSTWGLSVELDQWVDPVWQRQGNVISVLNPLHGASVLQRPGVFAFLDAASYYNWYDDLELWAPS